MKRRIILPFNFTCPVQNASEFYDVGIVQIYKLPYRLLAAVVAAAVDQSELVFGGSSEIPVVPMDSLCHIYHKNPQSSSVIFT
ncbi:MAG: hypothetical protein ACI4PO_10825 [Faecousia sp.]